MIIIIEKKDLIQHVWPISIADLTDHVWQIWQALTHLDVLNVAYSLAGYTISTAQATLTQQ